jgi:hypothetical protein
VLFHLVRRAILFLGTVSAMVCYVFAFGSVYEHVCTIGNAVSDRRPCLREITSLLYIVDKMASLTKLKVFCLM